MVLIEYTNILVDEFAPARSKPYSHYVFFLTHMHTDHFNGLSDSWNFGTIYCSPITASLLFFKFPKLVGVIKSIEMNKPTEVPLDQDGKLSTTVTFLDANHCAGAVMILFEGYFGTVLHTGDIRFNRSVFEQHDLLYPSNSRNATFQQCSKHVDVLHLDNTFCDPAFQFPSSAEAMKDIMEFVSKIGKRKLYVGLDNIGKEEILVELSKKFETCIVVDGTRYKNVLLMGHDPSIFTTDVTQGWIEVVPKRSLRKRLFEQPTAIGIVPTGWANKAYFKQEHRIYFAPYSLHSNFQELRQFVKSISPAKIIPIVRSRTKKEQIDADYEQADRTGWKNAYEMASVQQKGLEVLSVYKSELSEEYRSIMLNVEMQKKINGYLSFKTKEDISRGVLREKPKEPKEGFDKIRKPKKGAKLSVNVDQTEVAESKKMLLQAIEEGKKLKEEEKILMAALAENKDDQVVEVVEVDKDCEQVVEVSKEVVEASKPTEEKKEEEKQKQEAAPPASPPQEKAPPFIPKPHKQGQKYVLPRHGQAILDAYFLKRKT